MANKICFYQIHDKYGCLSNFYPAPIEIDGIKYATTEHYFQAMKAKTVEDHNHINASQTPGESKKRGRSVDLRDGWEDMKDNVMRVALATKFSQHDNLAKILLSTGDNELIELTDRDLYWGRNHSGQGKNMLGELLMELREKIRENG